MSDKIPDEVAAKILAKCGRCCCLCRRFRPTMLQVHHIIEHSKGGTDDLDNLIAICLTCHSDVHTKRPFTRRFTSEELRDRRDTVFTLVAEGMLVPPEEDEFASAQYQEIPLARFVQETGIPNLPTEAVDILLAAAESRKGRVLVAKTWRGFLISTDSRNIILSKAARDEARFLDAMKILKEEQLLTQCRYDGEVYHMTADGFELSGGGDMGERLRMTHKAYLLADQLLALRARDVEG